ncbi:MAG TPA: UvrD-helicase domain-containing protein [Candidatus Binataceae bacterium]|nr:UvrD-helicase domain-containing protein [Candidatus Binataceae bacterium]
MTAADQRVRDRIRNDLDSTLLIEAAAGTGKTTALVNRIVSVIEAGRGELARIVAVTFTEKAAGELKLRLRAEIERARNSADPASAAQNRLTAALKQLEEARIGTIHAFCGDLLREWPVEAGVDPMFEVASEDFSDEMFEAAFQEWFERALQNPGPGMRRLLRRRDISDREGPREIARRAALELLDWRDFDSPWRPHPFERDREIDAIVADALKLGHFARCGEPDDWLARGLEDIARPVEEAVRLETVRGRDYDALEAVLIGLSRGRRWDWKGFGGNFGDVSREEAIRSRDALRARLEKFRADAGANLAPLLREELWPIAGIYEELKRRAGRLDFLDLLLMARNLVRDNCEVRAALQERFTHIFIDEFQDTDPLQAEILMLLAANDPAQAQWLRAHPRPGKLFIVGDPKQSIYRFRRADVALYQAVKANLIRTGAAVEYLSVSFRATPQLQQMVNAAFAPLMENESATQPSYAPLMPSRSEVSGQPPIVVLPVPEPYGDYGRVVDWRIDQSLPDAIAAFAKWIVTESGWTVTEREAPDRRIPIEPRHICILFRRMNSFGADVTRPYLRALEARHLPHVLVKGGSFNDREEVIAIRNLLGAIERPDDELMVFASLHGPIFALSDAALLEFRSVVGSLHPFRKLPDGLPERLAEVRDALAVLRDLHRGRNRRPIAETIAMLLAGTRAHAGIAIWPTGEQALGNLMRIMDQARRFEARSGATSFRAFVDELERRAERDEASEVPIVEEGTAGIRIMTVHRAKGLEFPAVILADITCRETRGEPSRFADPSSRLCAIRLAGCAPLELQEHAEEESRRDTEEAIRLLYVASTRARDLLVVPAVGDGEYDGWLARLSPAIYPSQANWRTPQSIHPPGCPEFGDDSVLTRPPKAPGRMKSATPGLHKPARGEHQVVWWDPSRLILGVEEAMGLRQNKLLQADQSGKSSNRGKKERAAWESSRKAMLETGTAPALKIATATELSHAVAELPAATIAEAIALEETTRDPNRPHGMRFGSLVHLAMLRVAFDAGAKQVRDVVAAAGRVLGATPEEIKAAAPAIEAALKSKLIQRAKSADRVMRECPLLVQLDDGTTVEGIADLAFAEPAPDGFAWTVVDFKTDIDISPRINEYRAQIGYYVRAVRSSTNRPASGAILWL